MGDFSKEGLSFENAVQELENIIDSLEAGEVPLDETIKLYERGTKLKQYCEEKLASAEEKIQRISESKTTPGKLVVEDVKDRKG